MFSLFIYNSLALDYYPDNADNINQISWESSDDSIVSVEQDGHLIARYAGQCRIICTAENVSAQCICTVKPYMREIVINTDNNGCISMTPMQVKPLSYSVIPEDCIDNKVLFLSSDCDVVNVVDSSLYAKKSGTAQITVRNTSGSISKVINVIVGQDQHKENKKGFFKRLFT